MRNADTTKHQGSGQSGLMDDTQSERLYPNGVGAATDGAGAGAIPAASSSQTAGALGMGAGLFGEACPSCALLAETDYQIVRLGVAAE